LIEIVFRPAAGSTIAGMRLSAQWPGTPANWSPLPMLTGFDLVGSPHLEQS
jgi:hypothetical protein